MSESDKSESLGRVWSADTQQQLIHACGLAHLDVYASLASTNDLGLEMLRDGWERWPTLLVAETQTAGRGRGVNRWWSEPGGLTFSLLVPTPSVAAGLIPLAVGVGLARALSLFQPPGGNPAQLNQLTPRLKWPNDVFLGTRKVAGILVETASHSTGVVIGCGVNVNQSFDLAPEELRERATSWYRESGQTRPLPETLQVVVREILSAVGGCQSDAQGVLAEFRNHCLLTGSVVQVAQGTKRLIGRCRGIDQRGHLLLETETGEHTVSSGTVIAYQSDSSSG